MFLDVWVTERIIETNITFDIVNVDPLWNVESDRFLQKIEISWRNLKFENWNFSLVRDRTVS